MFDFLRNIFSRKSKQPITTEPIISIDENISIDEKATIISDSFSDYIKSHFDFDAITIVIEDFKKINEKSTIFQILYSNSILAGQSELDIRSELSFLGDQSSSERRLILFKCFRTYINNSNNIRYLVGILIKDTNNIYFPMRFNKSFFDHYKFSGKLIPSTPNTLDYKMKQIHFCHYYIYEYSDNTLNYFIDIPIEQQFRTLNVRENKEESNYFPDFRCYQLLFRTTINKKRSAYKFTGFLYYKDTLLREKEFSFFSDISLKESIDKMLFPFNLNDEFLETIGLQGLTLYDIFNDFSEHEKIKEMIEI